MAEAGTLPPMLRAAVACDAGGGFCLSTACGGKTRTRASVPSSNVSSSSMRQFQFHTNSCGNPQPKPRERFQFGRERSLNSELEPFISPEP
jgi:hypothetical protein